MARLAQCAGIVCLILILFGTNDLNAQWLQNGTPVSRAGNTQGDPYITADGLHGAVISWEDYRNGNYDIFAQAIDVKGNVKWTTDGVVICDTTQNQYDAVNTFDGSGGAIITWYDYRNGNADIYVQKIDVTGSVQWTPNGVFICANLSIQDQQQVISDDAGGAIIVWRDYRNGNADIYIQKINGSGSVQYAVNGISVCAFSMSQTSPRIVSDGSGGAIITWQDYRGGDTDIYAQRIDHNGNKLWGASGTAVCADPNNQNNPEITPDGSGGAIIAWYDNRSGNPDIYAQKINSSGIVQWAADGIAICTATGNQTSPHLVTGSSGGAIITWYDQRDGSYDVYAQATDAIGNILWAYNGVAISTGPMDKYNPRITSDDAGGAIITWQDYRSANADIYAQRIDGYGAVQWQSNGLALCTNLEVQYYPRPITDGAGNVIVSWEDHRNASTDIYALRIDADGSWGHPAPKVASIIDVPGDEGGYVNIAWNASDYDALGDVMHYTIWRALNISQAALMIDDNVKLISTAADVTPDMQGPVIRIELSGGNTYYWEMIDSHDAYQIDTYSKIVSTAFDSSAVCSDYHYFQIIAHTGFSSIFYVSAPDSGYSVDNLAPCPPLCLAGAQSFIPKGLTLTWDPNTELDLDGYAIYRGLSVDFVPGHGNLIASPCDTCYFDGGWTWDSGYCYKIAAIDVHGNESEYALLCSDNITGEEPPATPLATYLGQNYPNPFNPSTRITFGLNAPGHVSLRIYDAAGRLVRVLVEDRREAGVHNETWNGRDDSGQAVASGVYFYSLTTGRFKEAKKMVLLK